MASTAVAWILAAIGLSAAIAAGIAARAELQRRTRLQASLDEAEAKLAAQRADHQRKAQAFEQRGRELAALKQQVEKRKRRSAAARHSHASQEERTRELEENAELRRQQAEEARLRAERLAEQLARKEGELAKLRAQSTEPPATPAWEAEQARLTKRLAASEAELQDLTAKLRAAEQEASRYRSRERTHRRLYIVVKGELDAAKDRLRLLEKPPPKADTVRSEAPPRG